MRKLLCLLSSATVFASALWAQSPSSSPEAFLRQFGSLPLPDVSAERTRGLESPYGSKIDPRLRRSAASVTARPGERSVSLADRLSIVATASTLAEVDRAKAAIRADRGEVSAEFQNTIWATVPSDSLSRIASNPAISALTLQPEQHVEQQSSNPETRHVPGVADGIGAAHLQLLQDRGFSGKGVKVGILDLGFGGYSRLLAAGRVPAFRAARAFPSPYKVENSEIHGSACAEIVFNAAPRADIYLASFDGHQGRMIEAALWLISQGVQVISYSAGTVEAANDGTDIISRFVDYTTRRYGVLWVIAAGNEAQRHWTGLSSASSDGFIQTTAEGATGLVVTPLSDHLHIVVRWNDWGPDPNKPSASQDIDAYLLALSPDKKSLTLVAKSDDPQTGTGASLPLEVIDLTAHGLAGTPLLLKLKATHVTRSFAVHVFLESGTRLYPIEPAGSILNPASSRSALAVGGVDVVTGDLAGYSAHGPTDDNRLKPEVSAPTNTISWTYASDTGRFAGTSAACPHVAGFAALLREMYPQLTASELRLLIMRSVLSRGTPKPNSAFGYGEIDAAQLPKSRSRGLQDVQDAGALIRIPSAFGGTVSIRTLEQLRTRQQTFSDGLKVRVITGRDLYRIGDQMRIGLVASEDCACLLFAKDATGTYSYVARSPETLIALQKGKPEIFPSAEGQALEITGPSGTDELLLVCSPQPFTLSAYQDIPGGLAISTQTYTVDDQSG